MKALIIGYGSIGRRHHQVLLELDNVEEVHIVTKQMLDNIIHFRSIEDIENLDVYDYFIIASETHKHFTQLKYLESKVSNKRVFCEKPLFEVKKELNILKNKVFVGYVLRFHPLLQKLKTFLQGEKVINVHVKCGSYLPTWRQNIDYRDSYSAKKEEGGGVLLDLSHEIDYVQWLFGKVVEIKSYQMKVSDLEINSDDLVVAIGKTSKGTIVNLSLDYISKMSHRKLMVDTDEKSFELDLINNILITKDKNSLEQKYEFPKLERNYMFEQMHKSILSNEESVCTFLEGMEVMETISKIQEQNQ